MIIVKLSGGLGNQLFQIFTTIAYAIESQTKFAFPSVEQLGAGQNGSTIRYTYWDSFLSNLKRFTVSIDSIKEPTTIVREKEFKYNPIIQFDKTNPNITAVLSGYFQSPLYFNKYATSIFKLIGLETHKKTICDKLINFDTNNTISMHFRRGDYKKYPNIYPILTTQFYSDSIQYIQHNSTDNITKVIYFCEDEDIEDVKILIHQLQVQVTCANITFERANPELNDWEQMIFMSLCKYNIIANSTFSWWGSYFNTIPEQIVCCPSRWFVEAANKDTTTLYPKNWIQIVNN